MTVIVRPDGYVTAVVSDSPLGEMQLTLGPVSQAVLLDPVLLSGIEERVGAIAVAAANHVGQALATHPQLCSRCARTLMRSAMGDPQARTAVGRAAWGQPLKPGDGARYAAVDAVMGHKIVATRQAVEGLSAQLSSGNSRAVIEQVMEAALKSNPWTAYYHTGADGAPMKMGQWEEFKSCACAPPGGDSPTPMPVESMVGSIGGGR